jgi:hypothetical protein
MFFRQLADNVYGAILRAVILTSPSFAKILISTLTIPLKAGHGNYWKYLCSSCANLFNLQAGKVIMSREYKE